MEVELRPRQTARGLSIRVQNEHASSGCILFFCLAVCRTHNKRCCVLLLAMTHIWGGSAPNFRAGLCFNSGWCVGSERAAPSQNTMANLIHCDLGKMHHSHLNVIMALPQMHKAETNGHIWTYSTLTNPIVILFFLSLLLSHSPSLYLSPSPFYNQRTPMAKSMPGSYGCCPHSWLLWMTIILLPVLQLFT